MYVNKTIIDNLTVFLRSLRDVSLPAPCHIMCKKATPPDENNTDKSIQHVMYRSSFFLALSLSSFVLSVSFKGK